MKKSTLKEIGKLYIDISKIIFAIAILLPLVNNNEFSLVAFIVVIYTVFAGFYFINKGD